MNIFVDDVYKVLGGATTGATVAILRNAPIKQYTITTALNCGVFGATFFSMCFFIFLFLSLFFIFY